VQAVQAAVQEEAAEAEAERRGKKGQATLGWGRLTTYREGCRRRRRRQHDAVDRPAVPVGPGAARFSEYMVYTTKVSGNSPISAKSIKTVFSCWSTPKLLGCMSDWVNMRQSPLISMGDSCFWACREKRVRLAQVAC
jgi:hypothetical protein